MKLYDFGPAANSKRVRMFLAEKGLDIPTVQLNVRDDEQFKEPFTSMNPFHCVPFLELDDGTVIAESISVCRYLEELHPEPSLFGSTPAARGIIDMWNRRVELDGFIPLLHATRNDMPLFAGRVVPGTRTELVQLPAMVERGQEMAHVFFARLEPQMADNEFIAGNAVSIADITAWFVINMANRFEMGIAERYPAIHRWHTMFSARPSTDA
ncbi:MAG: glutathione S-transferase family protein [Alphaproteobacteria bacterium]|jgi:glutathione S-transferase|nr:glutathione S-transferase family protein [Alphaproteobacteria bacterium]